MLASLGFRAIGALRWLTWVGVAALVGRGLLGLDWLPEVGVGLGAARLAAPRRSRPGASRWGPPRPASCSPGCGPGPTAAVARVHLRLWLAERLVDELGATSLSSAPLVKVYARLLGCRVGRHVDLHSVPPVTGLLTLGDGCSVEPEVDLAGHWLDGGHLHIGEVRVGADARVGARSTLLPGADVGDAGRGGARLGRVRPRPRRRGVVGRARPAHRRGARALGPTTARRTGRRGWSRTPRRRSSCRCCRSSPCSRGLAVALPALRRGDEHPGCRGHRRRCGCPSSTVVGVHRPRAPRPRSGAAALARARGRPRTRCTAGRPGRRGRSCACSTRPGPGCSRCTPRP